jgi:hypothetical protein
MPRGLRAGASQVISFRLHICDEALGSAADDRRGREFHRRDEATGMVNHEPL